MPVDYSCCGASRESDGDAPGSGQPPAAHQRPQTPRNEVSLAGGRFLMGDCFGDGYFADGEAPVHEVELGPFSIDVTCVTVSQFARFVDETGYRTEAERFGNSAVFHLSVRAKDCDVIGTFGAPWWLGVRGADWRHPYGPESGIEDLIDHPVVHVSHNDALAFCAWSGRELPTEAEWEYAARGGRVGQRFPWGDELEQDGKHHANVWQGEFPHRNLRADGFLTTAPARHYEPNGFGLYQMTGNVWEWCADWFNLNTYARSPLRNPQGPERGTARVVRGGSYLCHHSHCSRYRLSARSSNTPDSSTGNTGFRTVKRR